MKRSNTNRKSHTSASTKRIHNPVTKSYYSVRVRTTSSGRKGTITGKWTPKK